MEGVGEGMGRSGNDPVNVRNKSHFYQGSQFPERVPKTSLCFSALDVADNSAVKQGCAASQTRCVTGTACVFCLLFYFMYVCAILG